MARIEGGYGDYGAVAPFYDKGRMPFPKWLFTTLAQRAHQGVLPRYVNILDVGCGTGVATRQLKAFGYSRVQGIDVDPHMINAALHLRHLDRVDDDKSIKYSVSGVEDFMGPMGKFHAITSFGALPWFHDVPGAMENIHRMLRPGGIFFAADEHPGTLIPNSEEVRRKYVTDFSQLGVKSKDTDTRTILKTRGFRDVRGDRNTRRMRVPIEKVVHYIMAGSWMNLVPSERIPELEQDLTELCSKYAEGRHEIDGTFAFSCVWGRK